MHKSKLNLCKIFEMSDINKQVSKTSVTSGFAAEHKHTLFKLVKNKCLFYQKENLHCSTEFHFSAVTVPPVY